MQVLDMLIAMVAILPKRLVNDSLQMAGQSRRHLPKLRRIVLEYRADQVKMAFPVERAFAGKKLEHHDTETKYIAARIYLFAAGLLRRHIGSRAQDHSRQCIDKRPRRILARRQPAR